MSAPIPDWAIEAAASILANSARTRQGMAQTIANAHSRAIQTSESTAELKATTLRRALVGLVGVDTAAELDQMDAAMRAIPAPDEDKAAMLNAIHALKATL